MTVRAARLSTSLVGVNHGFANDERLVPEGAESGLAAWLPGARRSTMNQGSGFDGGRHARNAQASLKNQWL